MLTSYYGLRCIMDVGLSMFDAATAAIRRKEFVAKYSHLFEVFKEKEEFSVFAIAFPPKYGREPEHFRLNKILEFWKDEKNIRKYKDRRDLLCLGEYIAIMMLRDDEPMPLTDRDIISLLSSKHSVEDQNVIVSNIYKTKKLNWPKILLNLRKINLSLQDHSVCKISQYNTLTRILSEFQFTERDFMLGICKTVFCGPLESLACVVDAANISYVLGRLKPHTTISMLHKLCDAPTWQGKLSAIVSLIELMEVDMYSVVSESAVTLATFILKVVSWIMEKASIGVDYLQKQFGWNKAEQEDIEMQCDITICQFNACKEQVDFCCQLCCQHFCNLHRNCGCGIDFVLPLAECDCSNNQDCLPRALAKAEGMTTVMMKKHLYDRLKTDEIYQLFTSYMENNDMGEIANFEQFKLNIVNQLKVSQMGEVDMILLYGLIFKRTVVVNLGGLWLQLNVVNGARTIYLDNPGAHFELIEPPVIRPKPENNIFGRVLKNVFVTPVSSGSATPELSRSPSPTHDVDPNVKEVKIECDNKKSEDQKEKNDEEHTKREKHQFFDVKGTDELNGPYIKKFEQFIDPKEAEKAASKEIQDGACAFDELKKKGKGSLVSWLGLEDFGEFFKPIGTWFKTASVDVLEWFDDNPLICGLFSVIAGIASFFGLYTNFPTSKSGFAGIIDRFSGATRTMHYAQSGFRGIFAAAQDTLSEMKNFLGISSDKEICEFKESLASALESCKDLLTLAKTKPALFVNNASKFMEFQKTFKQISEKYRDLTKFTRKESRELVHLQPLWFALTKTYESLQKLYTKFVNGSHCRQVPVCLYLYGKTGVGKSTVLTEVANELNIQMQEQMSVFTVSKGPEYWNGFAQQAIIRVDDVNAIMDAEGDVDSVSLFNLITDAPFNPNQAALEDKLTMANPRFVICASMHETLPSNTIVSDVEAWESRRHFCVQVSWPEHERCGVRNFKCPHYQKFKANRESGIPSNFDHLTFTLVDPVMSKNNQKINSNSRYNRTGRQITFKELCSEMVELEKEQYAIYREKLERAIKCGTAAIHQTAVYGIKPTVMVMGPPGTGKSFIFEQLAKKEKTLHIKTTNELIEFFEKQDFSRTRQVIIDDLSTHYAKPDLVIQVLDLVKQRYDQVAEDVPYKLFIGVNDVSLAELVGFEYFDVVASRCEKVFTAFRKKSFREKKISAFHKTQYFSASDTRTSGDVDINKMVSYRYNNLSFQQSQIVNVLASIKYSLKEVKFHTMLDHAQTVKATCMTKIDITNSELTDLVNRASFMDVWKVLKNSKIFKCSPTSKVTQAFIFQHLASLATKARDMNGEIFRDIEHLFLVSWNSKLLEFLKGECAVLKLNDLVLYVDYTKSELRVGKLINPQVEVQDLVESVEEVEEMAKKGLLDGISAAMFPPWLMCAGRLLSTVAAAIGIGVTTAISVQDQARMYKAYSTYNRIDEIYDVAKEVQEKKNVDFLQKKFGLQNLSPGPSNIKAPQYGSLDDIFGESDPTKKKNITRESDPQKKKIIAREDADSESNPDRKQKIQRENKEMKMPREHKKSKQTAAGLFGSARKIDVPTVSAERAPQEPLAQTDFEAVFQVNADGSLYKDDSEVYQQITTDPQLYSIVDLVTKNMCEVLNFNGTRLCSGFFIKGNVVRTVLHVLDTNKEKDLRVRTLDGRIWRVKVETQEDFYDRLDLVIIDKQFQNRTDITKHLPSKSNVICNGQYAVLVTPKFVNDTQTMISIRSYQINTVVQKFFSKMEKTYFVIDYRGHRVGYSLTSPIQTTNGDCGSVLVLADPSVNYGKIIGMHIAASDSVGYASPMWKEQYLDPEMQTVVMESKSDKFGPCSCEEPLCEGIAKYNVHIPTKTKLYRNVYPIGEKIYEPGILSKKDPRAKGKDIIKDEALKWSVPRKEIDDEMKAALYESAQQIGQHMVKVMKAKGVKLRVLTKTEALNKLSDADHSEPINIHTSAGYYWSAKAQHQGKSDYITVLDDGSRRFNKKNQQLVNELHNSIDNLLNENIEDPGVIVPFQVFLKDEPVKKSKIDSARTRTIAAAPLDFQIAFRMFFHAAHAGMMDCLEDLPIKIGINPTSLDWHKMYHDLVGNSDLGLDTDFKAWDFSHHPFLIKLLFFVYEILYSNLDPNYDVKDKNVRLNLYRKIICFYYLVGPHLFRSTGGIPSGYSGTSPDNSLLHWIMIVAIWILVMKKNNNANRANIESMIEDVISCIYADDAVHSITPWALQYFNGSVLKEFFDRIGFNMQPALKDGIYEDYKKVDDCIFLSRGFRRLGNYIVGPLQLERLCKPSWWVHDRRSHNYWEEPDLVCSFIEGIVSSYESMCYEAALHGEEFFYQVYDKAMLIYNETRLRAPPSYKACLARIFGTFIDLEKVDGVEFLEFEDLVTDAQQYLAQPANFKKFYNRTTWQYGQDYDYRGYSVKSNKMPKFFESLLHKINKSTGKNFNSILINKYPVGGEIPWHKDDEACLDQDEGVLGITIVGDGILHFKDALRKVSFLMRPGLGYLMSKHCLQNFYHCRNSHFEETISMTFRKIVPRQ